MQSNNYIHFETGFLFKRLYIAADADQVENKIKEIQEETSIKSYHWLVAIILSFFGVEIEEKPDSLGNVFYLNKENYATWKINTKKVPQEQFTLENILKSIQEVKKNIQGVKIDKSGLSQTIPPNLIIKDSEPRPNLPYMAAAITEPQKSVAKPPNSKEKLEESPKPKKPEKSPKWEELQEPSMPDLSEKPLEQLPEKPEEAKPEEKLSEQRLPEKPPEEEEAKPEEKLSEQRLPEKPPEEEEAKPEEKLSEEQLPEKPPEEQPKPEEKLSEEQLPEKPPEEQPKPKEKLPEQLPEKQLEPLLEKSPEKQFPEELPDETKKLEIEKIKNQWISKDQTKKTFKNNYKLFRSSIMDNKNIENEQLFYLFRSWKIGCTRGWFIEENGEPTDANQKFASFRNMGVYEFYYQYSDETEKNEILNQLIQEMKIPNPRLVEFFKNVGLDPRKSDLIKEKLMIYRSSLHSQLFEPPKEVLKSEAKKKIPEEEFFKYFAKHWGQSSATPREDSEALFNQVICNLDLSNEGLYRLFKKYGIRPFGGWFVKEDNSTSSPTTLAVNFVKYRKMTPSEFFRLYFMAEKQEEWSQNLKENKPEKNQKTLEEIFKNQNISNGVLYKFLLDNRIESTSSLFQNPDLIEEIKKARETSVNDFYAQEYVNEKCSEWIKNVKEAQGAKVYQKNGSMLIELIKDKNVAQDTFSLFCNKVGLDDKNVFLKFKPVIDALEKNPRVFPIYKAAAPIDVSIDPLQYMMTINGHGSFSTASFTLPNDVYILVPHPQGFDNPYILSIKRAFEPPIFSSTEGLFPTPSSGGWHLYKPGDSVRNIEIHPWSEADNPQEEYEKWTSRVPQEDANLVNKNNVPKFARVPVRDGKNNKIKYKEEFKDKIKVFGGTNLYEIIAEMRKHNKGQPIVFIPLTCNAEGPKDPKVTFQQSITSLNALFEK